jgi:cytochrome c
MFRNFLYFLFFWTKDFCLKNNLLKKIIPKKKIATSKQRKLILSVDDAIQIDIWKIFFEKTKKKKPSKQKKWKNKSFFFPNSTPSSNNNLKSNNLKLIFFQNWI